MRIVFLDRSTFSASIAFPVARLAAEWQEHARTAPGEVLTHAAEATAVVTNKVKLPAMLLEKLPRLKLVAVAATGVDHVDLDAARRLGIGVCNVRDYATHSVPEHVFTVLLALRRNLIAYAAAATNGTWSRAENFCLHTWPIEDLAGSTLGVIGGGTLGQFVARLGAAFNMRVLLAEQRAAPLRPGRVAFEQVLAEADVLSLHVPLTPATRNLIGVSELARMKPSAILINSARGGVVDELALVGALRAGQLAGAAVDVLTSEPPPADHPLLCANLPNLLVTPHIAWASRQAQQQLADEVVENIAAFMRGESRNRVV
ncbi:MAG TPA: D-2-hydroxyacid dehydrogenase [Acidiferrobacterales bacterium]|nr:D-2-hydroxyacid dehydrogenase [Acidiferrobacterales bacterium]